MFSVEDVFAHARAESLQIGHHLADLVDRFHLKILDFFSFQINSFLSQTFFLIF